MKKIFYLIILIILSINVTFAEEITELHEFWTKQLPDTNEEFAFSDKYIYVTHKETIKAIEKKTGKETIKKLGDNIYDLIEYNNNLYINAGNNIYKLDKDLNILKVNLNENEYNLGSLFIKDNILYSMQYNSTNVFVISEDLKMKTLNENSDGTFLVKYPSKISLYDKNENEIKNISVSPELYFKNIVKVENDYYILSNGDQWSGGSYSDEYAARIIKVDKNLNVLQTKDYEVGRDFIENIFIYNNQLYAESNTYKLYKLDSELNVTPTENFERPNIYDEYNGIDYSAYYYLENKSCTKEEYDYFNQIANDKNRELMEIRKNEVGEYLVTTADRTDSNQNILYIALYNKNKDKIFEKEYEYSNVFSVSPGTFFEDYVAIFNTDGKKQITFYDKKGNVVRDIELSNQNIEIDKISLFGQKNGLTLIIGKASNLKVMMVLYENQIIHFNYNPKVFTKVDGGGTVKVKNETSKYGEEIVFIVEPKKGYILSEVKVTDEFGNSIIFNDYTFTMPSADVTIEAVFKKEIQNPITSDIAIIACIAIIILGSIGTIYSIKKIAWLK